MSYKPANSNGQATAANSAPVVLASDQSAVPVAGVYNATPPSLSDGTQNTLQVNSDGNLQATLATSLDKDIDSIATYDKGAIYAKVTASGVVAASAVALYGYFVAASGSGVISMYDNASSASGELLLAASKAISVNDIVMLPVPILLTNGLYVQIESGTATMYVLIRNVAEA